MSADILTIMQQPDGALTVEPGETGQRVFNAITVILNQGQEGQGEEGPRRQARVVNTGRLNLRAGAGTSFADVGDLYPGDTPEVLEERQVGNDVWMRTGWKQWGAAVYQGVRYLEYVL